MNYKKIVKSEKARYAILNLLQFIPDKSMIKMQYRIKTGRHLDLNNPRRYSEKLQWYKLYYRNPLMPECADKYSVRKYVKERGFEYILNECYGVYDKIEQINWDSLPKSFVFKDTLGGGGRSMVFVYDKDKINRNDVEVVLQRWLNTSLNRKSSGREWIYEGRKHRIIAEKILVGSSDGDLPDYKFFCFNGKVFCSYMMQNYTMHHELGILGFLDRNFNLLEAHRADFAPMHTQPEKPKNYDIMVEIAEKISDAFPHVRVDFYNLDGKIVFGEMTFFNASGYVQFDPDSFDYEMGDQFILPLQENCKISR